jgi:heparan-alpha-glucosaminide N-acetyltransferase
MGAAMPLSFEAQQLRSSKEEILKKVVRRSIILFGLGLFLNNGSNLSTWRIPGVLQRFGLSYLVVSCIVLFVPKMRKVSYGILSVNHEEDEGLLKGHSEKRMKRNWYEDILPYWIEWVVASVLLLIYLLVTFLLDVPGCGRGYLGPGGIGDEGKYFHCTGGAAGKHSTTFRD